MTTMAEPVAESLGVYYDVRGPLTGFALFGGDLTSVTEYIIEGPYTVSMRTVGYFVNRQEAEEWVDNARSS